MNKAIKLLLACLFLASCSTEDRNSMTFEISDSLISEIDLMINQDNFQISIWKDRGLQPSSSQVINALNSDANEFLRGIKKINFEKKLSKKEVSAKIMALADKVSWDDFDTEEKEFIADVLSPIVMKMGFDPVVYF